MRGQGAIESLRLRLLKHLNAALAGVLHELTKGERVLKNSGGPEERFYNHVFFVKLCRYCC